jgi:PKD repeat protein
LNVCFSATASGLDTQALPWIYTWNFGDGTYPTPNVNDELPCHAFMAPNTQYTVTVAIQDQNLDVATGSILISTNPLTVSACANATNGPAPLLVQFNDGCGIISGGVPPYSVEWDFGDGSAKCYDWATEHAFDQPGTYYTSVKVTDSCSPPSVVTDTHLVITVTQLTVSVNATSDRLCGPAGTLVCFSGQAQGGVGPYTYTWDFGDGSPTVDLQSPCHTYDTAGIYTVSLTATDSLSSTDTDTHLQIVITQPLSVTTSVSRTSGYAPFTAYFTSSIAGGTGPYTYLWDFGDGSTSALGSPSHVYDNPGYYTVKLTVTDSCVPSASASDDHINLGIYPIQVTADVNQPCGYAPLNDIFTGTATGGVPPYTYSWDFGDGTSGSDLQNPSHSYLAVGNYTAVLTVTDSTGATGTGSVDVDITDPLTVTPSASLTEGPAPLTVNFSSAVSGGLPPYTYDWDFADGSQHSTSPADQHTMITAGVYDVALTVSDSCGHSVTETVSINAYDTLTPTVTATPACGDVPLNTCFSATVTGGVPPYSYSWNFGDGSAMSTELSPCHNFLTAGTYNVTVTVSDSVGNHATSAPAPVDVLVPFDLSAMATASAIQGMAPLAVNFTASVSGGSAPYTYDWDFGDGTAHSTAIAPQHIYTQNGVYTVTLTVASTDACGQVYTASDSHLTIAVQDGPSITIISPNPNEHFGASVAFSSSVFDNVPIVRVDYYVNGTPVGSANTPPYTFIWSSAGYNGAYSVSATVYDSLGRSATSNSVTFSVGNPILLGRVIKHGRPFRLKIFGNYLQPGCVIKINGVAVPGSIYKGPTAVVAKKGSALKAMVPKGVPVVITVTNPDGGVSNGVTYTR